jgi:hypothetical protein
MDFFPKALQALLAANLIRTKREFPERMSGQKGEEIPQLPQLPPASVCADRTRTGWNKPVNHKIAGGHFEALQLLHQSTRLADAQEFGEQDGHKTASLGIAEQGFHVPNQNRHSLHKPVRFVLRGRGIEACPEITVFRQKRLQGLQPLLHPLRHGQKVKAMPGRSRVHDNAIVISGGHPLGDFQEGHEFVHAGQREFQELADVLLVQEGSARCDLAQFPIVFGFESRQAFRCVEFQSC